MDNYELLGSILNNVREEMSNEELMHMLISEKVSHSSDTKETFGERASDKLASFAGSWTFIIVFTLVLIGWIVVNGIMLTNSFDPYPFILLNLVLSCVAAVQAPLIMMSQKRQEQKDRERAQNDFKVNLKCEIIIEDLHRKLDTILENQEKILSDGNNRHLQNKS